MTLRIAQITLTIATISPKTRWAFLEIAAADGLAGIGEATLNGQEAALLREADRVLAPLPGKTVAEAMPTGALPQTLPEAAIRSALDQALRDLAARGADRPLWRELAPTRRADVPVYANINRRTLDRSPEGFAASARAALAAGHDAFKIAPFDEATKDARAAGALAPAIEQGFKRIAAVRDVVGERRLMVDCHWRFDEASAFEVIRRAAELELHWVECPLPETSDHLPALRRLREAANARGVRLAGCEEAIGVLGFVPFFTAGAYDVVMPDVKYVGGLQEAMRVAEAAQRAGVLVSPHNPSGPVSHAISIQLSAVLPAFDRLEMQFDETPLFASLVRTTPPIAGGAAQVLDGPGSGVSLDPAALAACAGQRCVYAAR